MGFLMAFEIASVYQPLAVSNILTHPAVGAHDYHWDPVRLDMLGHLWEQVIN